MKLKRIAAVANILQHKFACQRVIVHNIIYDCIRQTVSEFSDLKQNSKIPNQTFDIETEGQKHERFDWHLKA